MQQVLAWVVLVCLFVFGILPAIGRDYRGYIALNYLESLCEGLRITFKVLGVAFLIFLACWSIQTLGA